MKLFKKSIIIPLIVTLAIGFSGCESVAPSAAASSSSPQTASSSASAPASTSPASIASLGFSLPYSNVPSFNPLLPASDVNKVLWPLIYDCLAEPDTSYNPVMRLASSITITGNTVTVTLKNGILFSDGSSLSAQDVQYSFNFVKAHPASPYFAQLSNISSISAHNLTVTFTLITPDPLIANLLDFPIIKKDSDTTGNAIGSGRYTYSKDGVNAVLTLNPRWYNGSTSAFSSIPLVDIPNPTAVMSSLAIGEVNYVYSDSGAGSVPAAVNTTTASVNINQLVFVGVNTSKPWLNNAHFRRALSLSVDRNQLVSQNFSNHALPSVLPFYPSLTLLPPTLDMTDSADFGSVSSEMALAKSSGGAGAPALTLLVDQENAERVAAAKYVASCFTKAGVNVTVNAVPFSTYQQMISQGNFDLYIGEVKLSDDMDISPLLASGGSCAFGAPANSSTLAAFEKWRSGSSDFPTVVSAFTDEMPFIPLCYRTGTTSFTSGLTGVTATDSDIFYNFENWSYK